MSFITEYIKHPRKIGAVAPSGKYLAQKMMAPIDFSSADVIVEYGPGTGSFTEELIAIRREGTALILIEQNRQFCRQLKEKYGRMDHIHIVHGSAEHVVGHLQKYGYGKADVIVSGLPFASLPTDVSDHILRATRHALGKDGIFITFQYSLIKRRFFERYLAITQCLREMRNLPPAYVLVMRNR